MLNQNPTFIVMDVALPVAGHFAVSSIAGIRVNYWVAGFFEHEEVRWSSLRQGGVPTPHSSLHTKDRPNDQTSQGRGARKPDETALRVRLQAWNARHAPWSAHVENTSPNATFAISFAALTSIDVYFDNGKL
jgi:hypothetical protein